MKKQLFGKYLIKEKIMAEQPVEFPVLSDAEQARLAQIKANRVAGMAKARAARGNKTIKSEVIAGPSTSEPNSHYSKLIWVESFCAGLTSLQVRHPKDVSRVVDIANEAVKLFEEQWGK
jgi:hypothetical protein